MLLEMRIPSPGESISEVEIIEWLVNDGEYVEKDQTIAEIDSDKATLELPAEESGVISILVKEETIVNVGDIVCRIDTSKKKSSVKSKSSLKANLEVTEVKQSKKPKDNLFKASPLAASIIQTNKLSKKELGIKKSSGKIKKSDVLPDINPLDVDGSRGTKTIKMSNLRKKIASRLVGVKNEAAILTTFNEVDMSEIINLRKKYKAKFEKKHDVGLGFMSFFTKAVTIALLDFENVNAMINGDEIIYHHYIDIGIAVSAPKGLMVPVLRNTQNMSFANIESNIRELAIKAREGKITIQEMLGGTFTITNGGVFGSMLSTPIINPPQSAILGMHNIVERVIVQEGKMEIKPMMYLALSYDHRIIDGKDSVQFLCRIKEALEDPINLLLNNNISKSLGI
ncbi:MAG: 2-oxoglutarate dehydrogenase complex dihydrolipoyllysine-residue succinyltransferase [Bacteroidota bacterium]|nr:2-oxoglutarate dehydrogenase complex dihydrolipoyllysine-residue succinyltransferase [Bacteroidota bacterium]